MISHSRRVIIVATGIAIVIVAFFSVKVLAQAGATDRSLQTTLETINATQEFWDDLWKDTFTPGSTASSATIYLFENPVRFFVFLGIGGWIWHAGSLLQNNSVQVPILLLKAAFPMLIVAFLLGNFGGVAHLVSFGHREIGDRWVTGIANAQVASQSIRSALDDQLVGNDIRERIAQSSQRCLLLQSPATKLPSPEPPADKSELTPDQLQGYEYLACIRGVAEVAKAAEEEAINSSCGNSSEDCEYAINTARQASETAQSILKAEEDRLVKGEVSNPFSIKVGLDDFLAGTLINAAYGPLLSASQYLWTSFLEFAQYLLALFAPMIIAFAITPGRLSLLITWEISQLSIIAGKMAYMIIVGVVSMQLNNSSQTGFGSDIIFYAAMGLLAPAVSLAVVTAGGFAAAASFRSQAFGLIAGGASLAAGVGGSVAYLHSRYRSARY